MAPPKTSENTKKTIPESLAKNLIFYLFDMLTPCFMKKVKPSEFQQSWFTR